MRTIEEMEKKINEGNATQEELGKMHDDTDNIRYEALEKGIGEGVQYITEKLIYGKPTKVISVHSRLGILRKNIRNQTN